MSQQVWHDNESSLHKDHNDWAKAYSLQVSASKGVV